MPEPIGGNTRDLIKIIVDNIPTKTYLSIKNLNTIPLFFILFFIQNVSTAQNTGMLLQSQEPVTFEKVYLHTDRDFYFLGDTIWYKAYLLDGQSLSRVADTQNLYIDLIDSKGKITQNQVLVCENGEASGSIMIPDTTATGTLNLVAFKAVDKNGKGFSIEGKVNHMR